jgi:hypothetical protein
MLGVSNAVGWVWAAAQAEPWALGDVIPLHQLCAGRRAAMGTSCS